MSAFGRTNGNFRGIASNPAGFGDGSVAVVVESSATFGLGTQLAGTPMNSVLWSLAHFVAPQMNNSLSSGIILVIHRRNSFVKWQTLVRQQLLTCNK